MRDTIKLVITHFFIITVGALFVTSISDLIEGNKMIPAELPWLILLTGIITALPSFLFCFKKEPSKRQFLVRCVLHFFVIEAIVMFEGRLFGWYSEFLGGIILFCMVLFVYILVWTYSYFVNRTLANDINCALKRINENEENED